MTRHRTNPHATDAMDASRIEHLKMIQAVVNRLADNSFKYKGWSITLASALLALAAKDGKPGAALVGLVPVVAFWLLDAYYLWQERRFRALYDLVRVGADAGNKPADPTNFSMALPPEAAAIDPKLSFRRVAVSKTILPLHGLLLLVVAGVAAWLLCRT